MRKKSGFTIVEQAVVLVPEFENVVRKMEQQVVLRGQSNSTLTNYIRRIALLVLHFGKLPEWVDTEEIREYLVSLALDPKSPSRSSFKHMVYGLRYYFRLMGLSSCAALPCISCPGSLCAYAALASITTLPNEILIYSFANRIQALMPL